MTVGQLRKLIQDIPDDTPIVAPYVDHSLLPVQCAMGTGLFAGVWTRDYGEEATPEKVHGKRTAVLIVGSDWT